MYSIALVELFIKQKATESCTVRVAETKVTDIGDALGTAADAISPPGLQV